jgi:hypothetical protein
MTNSNSVMLVLQSPESGDLRRHREWCVPHRFHDVCRSPEVIEGELARCAEAADATRWSAAAYYQLDGNPVTFLDERLGGVLTNGRALGDVDEADASMLAIGVALTDRVRSRITPEAMGKERLLFIVLTNCTPGSDSAFNAWYTNQHIPDVLDVPGFVAARRYRLIDHPMLKPYPYRYLAVYEVLVAKAEAALRELNARAGTDRMYLSPTLETSDVYTALFTVEAVCGRSENSRSSAASY